MSLSRISTEALRADLMARGWTASEAHDLMDKAIEEGEVRLITFRIVADDDLQEFYVENFPQ